MRCRACHEGHAVGANQCVKAIGRNLLIVDHSRGDGITIERADIEDLLQAVVVADKERLK